LLDDHFEAINDSVKQFSALFNEKAFELLWFIELKSKS